MEVEWGDVMKVDEWEGTIRESWRILIAGVENSRGLEGLRFWEGRRPKSEEGRRSKLLLASMGWKWLMCEGRPLQREVMDTLVSKDEGNIHLP